MWPRDRREINTASLTIYPKVAREFVLFQNLIFSLRRRRRKRHDVFGISRQTHARCRDNIFYPSENETPNGVCENGNFF